VPVRQSRRSQWRLQLRRERHRAVRGTDLRATRRSHRYARERRCGCTSRAEWRQHGRRILHSSRASGAGARHATHAILKLPRCVVQCLRERPVARFAHRNPCGSAELAANSRGTAQPVSTRLSSGSQSRTDYCGSRGSPGNCATARWGSIAIQADREAAGHPNCRAPSIARYVIVINKG
jgi:hypothetical protein